MSAYVLAETGIKFINAINSNRIEQVISFYWRIAYIFFLFAVRLQGRLSMLAGCASRPTVAGVFNTLIPLNL